MKLSAVILAAGLGKRMQSATPKVLHQVLGKQMILHAVDAAAQVTGAPPTVIVGHGAEQVCQVIQGKATWAMQERQLGTAHAVLQAAPLLRGETDLVLVTNADMPLIRPETLAELARIQAAHSGPLTITTVILPDSHGFGRIVRGADGSVMEIVEEAQATPEILAIQELNVGVYCIRSDWLWDALERIRMSPKGEYYLTDLVGLAVADGLPVQGLRLSDPDEAIGVNTRVHLAEAERVLRARVNRAWMEQGVTMIDPATTTIEGGVSLGRDCVVWPGSILRGQTHVGEGCVIGPNSLLVDACLGDRCAAPYAVLQNVSLAEGTCLEPFTRLDGRSELETQGAGMDHRKNGAV